jgi:resuscitation-promoting factor RpfA
VGGRAGGGTAGAPESRAVTVHRGDSLWAIAARELGRDATDAVVAAAWPRWWAANRDVIGDDPDLLYPGQRLAAPGPDTSTGRTP